MKDQPIKLQLNSESAIRSIIDGDPELQIEIKNKISCAVAKGYERIDQRVIENSVSKLSSRVTDIVYTELTGQEKNGWNYKSALKPELKELIDKRVKDEVESVITQAVSKARDDLIVFVKERVDILATEIVRRTTNEVFDNSVRIEVNRRFDEMQKLIEKGE